MKKTTSKNKGRKSVEKRLIDSTEELVASISPNQLTIRDIADHAGVNHGQIHHYFGNKEGLLKATYRQMAFEHGEQLDRRDISANNLPDTALSDITNDYFSAIIRAVLDNKMDVVVQENDNLHVSRKMVNEITALKGLKKPSPEIKAAVALTMCIEFGLTAMKPYIEKVLDLNDAEMEIFIQTIVDVRTSEFKKLLEDVK